ncbi:MAG TPA: molybdopterin-dependent oxidoreductase [Anaerolineae bacterium]|nr:molybdopterin-dependent oxidoreductase [Anaerolineae bacterium]
MMGDKALAVTCNKDCGGGCPLVADMRDGRVVRLRDNPLAGRTMTGCPRGYEMPRAVYAPDRILSPLVRTGPRGSGQFREATWAEALDLVANRLTEVRERHGPASTLALAGFASGRGALHTTQRLTKRFLALLGGYTEITGGYSSAAADYVTPMVLGTELAGIDSPTLRHSRLIILWGANVTDTRLGCDTEFHIRQARRRGMEVIVLDPRRSATAAKLGTRWIPLRPGTDSALMMGVLYVLLREGLVDRPFVEARSRGFEALELHILGRDDGVPKTPAWAEAICGTPEPVIRELALLYGRTHPTALIPGLSIQRTVGGEEAIRLAIALQLATGNLGKLGGSSGGLTWGKLPTPHMGRMPLPPNPAGASIPVVQWPDAVLEGRAGGFASEVHAIYSVGSNYVVQGSDLHKSLRAYRQVEFSVCHEYALTPTALQCDVVLPATTFLEREDIVFPAGGNYLLYSNQAVPPQGAARNDYDIFCDLAERMGLGSSFSEGRSPSQWLKHFLAESDVSDVAAFQATGIFWGADQDRVGLCDFARDPQANPLNTPSGKVEIAPAVYAATGSPAVPTCRALSADPPYPLWMVTPHSRFRTHSQYETIPWFKRRTPQFLWMSPGDAAARGISDGERVLVQSRQGRMRIPAHVTDEIMPGVVCLLQGTWPVLDPDGVESAGCANVLTSTEPTLPSRGPRTHSVQVEVQKG